MVLSSIMPCFRKPLFKHSLRAVTGVNRRQWKLPLKALLGRFNGQLQGIRVAVLGLTFKPGVSDLTEAPAVELLHALVGEGAVVTSFDPGIGDTAKWGLPRAVQAEPEIVAATARAQAVVLMTEWNEIVNADWAAVSQVMVSPRFIYDGRNALDPQILISLGFEYQGVGINRVSAATHRSDSLVKGIYD